MAQLLLRLSVVIKPGEERLQFCVLNFSKGARLETLVLFNSQCAKSVQACVIGDTLHFVCRQVAVLRFIQPCHNAIESEVITFWLPFQNIPTDIAKVKHGDAERILLLRILRVQGKTTQSLSQPRCNQSVVELRCCNISYFLFPFYQSLSAVWREDFLLSEVRT